MSETSNNKAISATKRELNYSPQDFLKQIHSPNSVIQVFVKGANKSPNYVGFYEIKNLECLERDVQRYSDSASGVFYGLNPVNPACLERSKNCIQPAKRLVAPAKESDVLERRWMLVDIDPVRPGDCSATDEEKENAFKTVRGIWYELILKGWSYPGIVDSGNGYHMLFRIDLPVQDNRLIRNCLRALAAKFDTPEVKVDTKVFDARRVAKLPGTMARKGKSTQDRPHRISGLYKSPNFEEPVPRALLEDLASKAPPESKSQNTGANSSLQNSNNPKHIDNARKYLAKMPPAISGEGGRGQFLNAACRMVDDFALSREQALLLLSEYNQRCEPPFSPTEIDDKLDSALAKVSERGGPTGSKLIYHKKTPCISNVSVTQKSRFIGYIPDFGLVASPHGLRPANGKPPSYCYVLIWLIWLCQRSEPMIPDILLRQLHWGSKFGRNWKDRLKKFLEKEQFLKPVQKSGCSAENCFLKVSGVKHGHYSGTLKNYGVLDVFCNDTNLNLGNGKIFQIYAKENWEKRATAQRNGVIFNVYWPAFLLGGSRKVGWPFSKQRMLAGIVLELTRTQRQAHEDIVGEIIENGLVPISKDKNRKEYCPLISKAKKYVVFGGNGKRKGLGYQVVGRSGKGWLHRTGYLNIHEKSPEDRRKFVKEFLNLLASLTLDLGLIPAAVYQGNWKTLDEMIDLNRTGNGQDWLDICTLRIFALSDWRQKWRQFFSDQLGFDWIPESPNDPNVRGDSNTPRDLNQITTGIQVEKLLKNLRLTQQQLAVEISEVTGKKCSVRRIQRHISGKSKSPDFFNEVDQVRLKFHGDTQVTISHENATQKLTSPPKMPTP